MVCDGRILMLESEVKRKAKMRNELKATKPYDYDSTGAIIAYESGELDEEATLELFQYLVNSGLAWQLQGSYGRTATALIQQGLINEREDKS
jgi:hypothetical protein